ncbi:cytochrome c oxidase subunit II [Paraburkholderia oxyphila]|uniref:cytochrome c oxidase subunit II n=1 Tax=Paraburkholderia oxyphila TaxID=614212 RepID=UPI000487677F|nr:cytochrome c oxidase subunit II [Paraburkholderia oxyphila]
MSEESTSFEQAFHHSAERHERVWIFMALVMLALLTVCAMFYVVYDYGVVVKGAGSIRDPDSVMDTPAFRDGQLVQTGPDSYAVHVVGHIWQWTPGVIHVKQGSEVTFYVTSSDVLHGFEVQGTTINLTAVPGAVGKVTYTFSHAGTYHVICNEYCGIEHHSMIGSIVVDPKDAS